MNYRGRTIDSIALWGTYCDFPTGTDQSGQYVGLVRCPNPQHDTNKRHFQINQADGLVHCFAECGISGTYEHALAIIHGYYKAANVEGAKDAKDKRDREWQARRRARKEILSHGRVGRANPPARNQRAASKRADAPVRADISLPEFQRYLPEAALEYLEARGIYAQSIAKWELAWNPENLRIVIPYKDERGVERFVIQRTIKDEVPKYLYTEGAPLDAALFGARHLDPVVIRSTGLVLVEGSLDAIRLHQHGLTNTVSILGSRVHRIQRDTINRMRPKCLYLMFDRDTAGIAAILSARKAFPRIPLFVCRYPSDRYDPAELTKREVERSIQRALPMLKFLSRLPEAIVKG